MNDECMEIEVVSVGSSNITLDSALEMLVSNYARANEETIERASNGRESVAEDLAASLRRALLANGWELKQLHEAAMSLALSPGGEISLGETFDFLESLTSSLHHNGYAASRLCLLMDSALLTARRRAVVEASFGTTLQRVSKESRLLLMGNWPDDDAEHVYEPMRLFTAALDGMIQHMQSKGYNEEVRIVCESAMKQAGIGTID